MVLIKLHPATSFGEPQAHVFALISDFSAAQLFIILILTLIVSIWVVLILHRRLRFFLVHYELQFTGTGARVLVSI